MKSKVSLKELVGTKIVYALLLVCYYWTWARRDWHDYYETIQSVVTWFTVLFFALQASRIHRYHKEAKDELAVEILRWADALCLKLLIAAAVIIAFAGAVSFLDGRTAGYALVGTIFILAIIRFVAFCVMDSKGGCLRLLKQKSGSTGKQQD